MLNNTQTANIYKLYIDDYDIIYIGSTIRNLKTRLIEHKSRYKQNKNLCKSCELFEYAFNNNKTVNIELLEEVEFNNKNELLNKEKHYILNNICINRNIPTQTKQEYYINNKNKILEQCKQYYLKNKDKKRLYYLNNKTKILERLKNKKQQDLL